MAEKAPPIDIKANKKASKGGNSKLIKCGCYDVPSRFVADPPPNCQPQNFVAGKPIPGVLNSPAAHYQDMKHGVGMRVHNFSAAKNNYRCTICGGEKNV
jgi:hypothetical protein